MYRIGKRLRTLNISFGGACNKSCAYCLQRTDVQNKKGDPKYFISEFENFVVRSGIEEIETVHYWGGEPMLYFDQIKYVYDGINRMFPNIPKHRITTNGTLINSDYINFCNKNLNIITVVSLHDGLIEDKQWRTISKIDKLCLSGLFHKKRISPLSYFYEWHKIKYITDRNIPIGIYMIKATDGCDKSFWLSKRDIDEHFFEIETIVQPLANIGEEYCMRFMGNFVFEMKNQHAIEETVSKCFNDKVLSLDLFGNRYCCHHNETKTNKISNIFNGEFYLFNDNPNKYFYSEKCQKCPAVNACKGGCYLTNDHDVECYYMIKKWEYYEKIKNFIVK